ncbi:hypothetical protein BS47DRAFT_1369628 [Hydnum rufescens UP504]|uniref:CCHC-type domain-containing protein n=1 Tax=Hydnum rufescens UP504 TaxID=1448309 RepID=A0A9P6ADE5_9AGAM|nr:hypothetical protein BS47DRAFT_1369628 [Hydnum rufescens UP504]
MVPVGAGTISFEMSKVQEPGDLMKLNIDDLTEKIGHLTIALSQFNPNKVMHHLGKFNISSIKCFMCGEQGHSLRECPETKAFIVKKVLKVSNKGHLVQLDSSDLPRSDINNRGVAPILFELLDQEFAMFGDYEYKVFLAERKQEDVELKRSELYVKDDPKGKKADRPNRAYVELPQCLVRQVLPTENPKVPTILKKETCTAKPMPALPNKDIEMCNATMDQPTSHKHKETLDDKGSPVAKAKSKTNPTLEDVVVELQENINVKALYKSLMEKQVTVKLGNVLGSSFELCKRLQTATKMQHVPIKLEISGSHNVEAIVSLLEHTIESKDVSLISFPPEQSLGLPSNNLGDLSDNLTPTEPMEFKPGKPPKQLLINCLPKKPLDQEINVVAFKSDDSEDNYTLDDTGLDTEDQAEQYYSSSELNMMVQSTQVKLELPMDPSGKDWILCGVSGHQVNLVGLCQDVPIQVGGVPLLHNFFITSDNIGQKDIILSQPWLFSYSARIEYMHGEGMNLQNSIPEFLSSIMSTISGEDVDSKKLGPSTFIQDGYSYHQAVEGSDNVTRFIFGNRKYKPVSIKVHPVMSYNPDSQPLVFKPLKLGDLPPLLTKPIRHDELKYMG